MSRACIRMRGRRASGVGLRREAFASADSSSNGLCLAMELRGTRGWLTFSGTLAVLHVFSMVGGVRGGSKSRSEKA